MIERGVIRFRDRRRQIVDMRGMKIGTITPTDLDGLIDYHNDAFAFFELKHRDAPLERGQQMALVRVVDAIARGGKRAALFVCSHIIDDPREDVPADRCRVRTTYEHGQWHEATSIETLREAVDRFLGLGDAVPTYQPIQRGARASLRSPSSACIHREEFKSGGRCWICDRVGGGTVALREREPGEEG
jgi:hypothetical protein